MTAPATGTLTRLDAFSLGVAAWRLGAGRARKEDPVSAAAGVVWTAGWGAGDRRPAAPGAADRRRRAHPAGAGGAGGAIGIDTDDEPLPLILDRITA